MLKIYMSFLIAFVLSAIASAEEHKVLQIGKTFTQHLSDEGVEALKNSRGKFDRLKVKEHKLAKISIKKGDSIKFINKDSVEHNVFGKGFDYHQKKDSEHIKTFDEPGERTIRCAIHPKMKLKVLVSE